jgi:hypothetical protein
MKTRAFVTILVTAATTAGATMAGCSGSNNPSNTETNTSTGETTGTSAATMTTTGASSSSTATGASTSSASSTAGTTVSDAGAGDGGVPACPSGLEDKITTCTATDLQVCVKGCGPDLPAGSTLGSNLGTKQCTCTAGTYVCADCSYISPLPLCYQEANPAPTCEAGVADKLPCGTPCTTGTGNDVCSTVSDAGKTEGCVCITGGGGNVWTCATTPW